MNEKPTPPVPLNERINGMVNIVLFVCDALSLPVLVILHRRIGSRRIGLSALGTLLVIPLWAGCFPAEDPTPMFCLLGWFLLGCVVARLISWGRRWLGDTVHRHSDGVAFPAYWLPFLRPISDYLEPVLVLVAGLVLLPVYQGLGSYMAIAAVARFIMLLARRAYLNERVALLRDQQLEQQMVVEQFRRISGR